MRGHSSLLAALDTAIEVTQTDIRSEWSIAKSKDDATGDSYSFKLEIVKIGHDIEGEEITSCVAEYGGSKTPSKKSKSSLGSNQATALKLIKERIKTSPHILIDGVPEGKNCLAYDEVVLFVSEKMTADSKHQKSSAITAITGLIKKGFLSEKEDWLWVISLPF